MLKKIISGGQTGVDRAALDAAIRRQIAHGGWVPRGRRTEDGPLPEIYQLEEIPTDSYLARTEKNVLEADGTLIISRGTPTGGTDDTIRLTLKHGKPILHIDLQLYGNPLDAAALASSWIQMNRIGTLNVAGPRASSDPRIYGEALAILVNLR